MNDSTSLILALVLALFAAGCAGLTYLYLRMRSKLDESDTERLRISTEMEALRQTCTVKEEACNRALADKEEACSRALADKDEACSRSLADKDAACAAAMKDKDEACKKLLEAKDASCAQAVSAKDAACAAATAEKDKACAAALEAGRVSCEKILAEKDAAIARKDDDCRKFLEEKNAEIQRILAEKEAALKRKDEDCRKTLAEKNDEIERFLAEKTKSFGETVKTLQESFGNLAAAKMKEHQADLTTLNKTQMETVLKPLRENLQHLQDLTQKAQNENVTLGKSMSDHVAAIGKIADALSGVSEALHTNVRYQGRKGEEILAEKLRQARLEENVNFFLQTGSDSDRPDAQVCDTQNRWFIIDSKVSLTAYLEYREATDEKVRAAKLADHVTSVRQKIDQLAKKKYPEVFAAEHRDRNYLPVTAMFVPYEASLTAALSAEPSLWKFAADNNVVLVTPLTLMSYMRLVHLAWQHEKEQRHQQAIVDTARELLKRTNDFLRTFEDIGDALDTLRDKYDKAQGIFVDARGAQSIANSARKLIDLNVKLEGRKGRRVERAECLKVLAEESEEDVTAALAAEAAVEESDDDAGATETTPAEATAEV